MLRSIILAVLMLSLVATGIPISDSLAHGSRRAHSHKKRYARQRRSRAWWRRHRAQLRRKRARALARRRRQPAANGDRQQAAQAPRASGRANQRASKPSPVVSQRAPFNMTVPASWTSSSVGSSGEVRFNVRTTDGRPAGTAILSPVLLPPSSSPVVMTRNKSLGGVSLSALRRTVIDRMVVEGGWVVNDIDREIGGRRVYIVLAQSGAPGAPRQSRNFYFVEVEGRVYSLALSVPFELAEPVASGSEQLMASLRASGAASVAVK